MEYFTYYDSPIGLLTLFSDNRALTGLYTSKQTIPSLLNKQENTALSIFKQSTAWLDNYFDGNNPCLNTIPILPKGTEFQTTVWEYLCHIPYGSTVTYGQIAKEIAKVRSVPRISAQAVGQAVGANPISIIIPCHRVIGKNGKLTGYAGGLDKKIWLLDHEKANFNIHF